MKSQPPKPNGKQFAMNNSYAPRNPQGFTRPIVGTGRGRGSNLPSGIKAKISAPEPINLPSKRSETRGSDGTHGIASSSGWGSSVLAEKPIPTKVEEERERREENATRPAEALLVRGGEKTTRETASPWKSIRSRSGEENESRDDPPPKSLERSRIPNVASSDDFPILGQAQAKQHHSPGREGRTSTFAGKTEEDHNRLAERGDPWRRERRPSRQEHEPRLEKTRTDIDPRSDSARQNRDERRETFKGTPTTRQSDYEWASDENEIDYNRLPSWMADSSLTDEDSSKGREQDVTVTEVRQPEPTAFRRPTPTSNTPSAQPSSFPSRRSDQHVPVEAPPATKKPVPEIKRQLVDAPEPSTKTEDPIQRARERLLKEEQERQKARERAREKAQELERKQQQELERKRHEELERQRKQQEELERRRKEEEELRRKREEELRLKREEEQRMRKEEEDRRREEERKKREEEEAQKRAAELRRKQEEDKRREEELRRREEARKAELHRLEEERKEAERKRKEAEDKRRDELRREKEREAARKRQEEIEQRKQQEELMKQLAEKKREELRRQEEMRSKQAHLAARAKLEELDRQAKTPSVSPAEDHTERPTEQSSAEGSWRQTSGKQLSKPSQDMARSRPGPAYIQKRPPSSRSNVPPPSSKAVKSSAEPIATEPLPNATPTDNELSSVSPGEPGSLLVPPVVSSSPTVENWSRKASAERKFRPRESTGNASDPRGKESHIRQPPHRNKGRYSLGQESTPHRNGKRLRQPQKEVAHNEENKDSASAFAGSATDKSKPQHPPQPAWASTQPAPVVSLAQIQADQLAASSDSPPATLPLDLSANASSNTTSNVSASLPSVTSTDTRFALPETQNAPDSTKQGISISDNATVLPAGAPTQHASVTLTAQPIPILSERIKATKQKRVNTTSVGGIGAKDVLPNGLPGKAQRQRRQDSNRAPPQRYKGYHSMYASTPVPSVAPMVDTEQPERNVKSHPLAEGAGDAPGQFKAPTRSGKSYPPSQYRPINQRKPIAHEMGSNQNHTTYQQPTDIPAPASGEPVAPHYNRRSKDKQYRQRPKPTIAVNTTVAENGGVPSQENSGPGVNSQTSTGPPGQNQPSSLPQHPNISAVASKESNKGQSSNKRRNPNERRRHSHYGTAPRQGAPAPQADASAPMIWRRADKKENNNPVGEGL